jgi:hypothetical protein
VAGCGSGRLVVPVPLDPEALRLPEDARELRTPGRAVQGIAAVLSHHLGFPLPERVMVYVYGSRRAFRQGLVEDARVLPARAAELSEFAVGIGKRRQLFLCEEGLERGSREWIRLLAHELVHVSQIELAQGEGRADQWVAEGLAEWAAFVVVAQLGLDTMAHRRAAARLGVRGHPALSAARLDLESLASPWSFTLRHRREGSLPTYQLTFLLVDYLVYRHGLGRVLDYFRAFALRSDRRENFRALFGQSLEEFEAEVVEHLRAVVR